MQPMTQIQPFQVPNFTGNLAAMQNMAAQREATVVAGENKAAKQMMDFELGKGQLDVNRGNLQVSKGQLALDAIKQKAEALSTERKQKIEAYDFALNMFTGVNSEEDLKIVRKQLKIRYPEYAEKVDSMLPEYNPSTIKLVRNSMRTETQRLKQEELNTTNWLKSREVSVSEGQLALDQTKATKPPGYELFVGPDQSQVFIPKGGEIPKGFTKLNPPVQQAKTNYDVFVGPDGTQRYIKQGDSIPAGFKRLDKKTGPSVVVQTGDLGKSAKNKLQKDIITGVQNVQSFQKTRELFKPKFLTLFGKKDKIIAEAVDKVGMSSDKQKKLITERAKWFRQAKQDFIAYRKWATGVAGGEKEMREIATAFPDPVKNSPTQYVANLDSIEETTKRILQLNADFLKLGINMDQPLDKIIESAKSNGFTGIPSGPNSTGVIKFIRDSQGNLIMQTGEE